MALTTAGTSQKEGEVYAMNFVYSGNFIAETELDHQDGIRMSLGMHPDTFEWVLNPGEQFETPEAVMTYSDKGLVSMGVVRPTEWLGHAQIWAPMVLRG